MTDTPSTTPASAGSGAWLPAIAAVTTCLALVDLGVESIVAGSPISWPIIGVVVLTVGLLAISWRHLGPTARVVIPLLGLFAVVAWGSLRLGSWADPGLRLATSTLPRIVLGSAILATLSATALLFGIATVRRAWYVWALVTLFAAYALLPLVRGLIAGASPVQVLGGAYDWQRLPAWLHGGYLATEVLLPIGVLAGVASLARSVVRRSRATWTSAGLVVVLAAFVVQSAELTRAGRPHLAGTVTERLLATVSAVPQTTASAVAQQAASAAPSGATPLPAAAPGGSPGFAQAVPLEAIAPPPGAVVVAEPGQPAANQAVEVRVSSHRTTPSLGIETARPGREFVVVEMSWKNLLPRQKVNRKKAGDRTAGAASLGFGGGRTAKDQAADEADTALEPVKFEVAPLARHLWLVADGRFAEELDPQATRALEGHLGPESISIADFQQTVSGGVAFEVAAGARALSILFLDSNHGHLLVPIVGARPALAGSLGGGSRANELVDLALLGASWSTMPAPDPGVRTLILGLLGISRRNAIVDVPFGEYGFLQTDQGCLVEPDPRAVGLTRSLAPVGRFLPFVPSEGQLAFSVPADSQAVSLLLRLPQGGPIDLPLRADAGPRWPAADATVKDGDVLRVLKLPGTSVPAGLPAAPSGSERIGLDLVVENLRQGAGIDLQAGQQFRVVTPDGRRIEPSGDSASVPCRLSGASVVPAGGARRFTLVYDVPPGQPLQLEYRGFNVRSELVKVR